MRESQDLAYDEWEKNQEEMPEIREDDIDRHLSDMRLNSDSYEEMAFAIEDFGLTHHIIKIALGHSNEGYELSKAINSFMRKHAIRALEDNNNEYKLVFKRDIEESRAAMDIRTARLDYEMHQKG